MCKAMEEIKKRERAIGFEIGFKEGYEEGYDEGFKEGFEEGLEEIRKERMKKNIEVLIESMHEFGHPREKIVKQIEKKFSLTQDEAESAVESCFAEQLS